MAKKKEPVDPLKDALAKIEGKFGKGAIRLGSTIAPISRVPCGIFALDCAVGIYEGMPGFPRGRVTMLIGEESSCKTLIMLKLMAEFQRQGERPILVDSEGDWDPVWSSKLNVDPEDVFVQPSESAEQSFDIMAELVRILPTGFIGVDSWAQLTPSIEITDSFDDQQRGAAAKLNNKAWRNFQAGMNTASRGGDIGPTILVIQQWRTGFSRTGGYRTVPGGAGQKFAASVVVNLRQLGPLWHLPGKGKITTWPKEKKVRDKVIVVGVQYAFEVAKNKTAPPKRTGEFEIYTVDYDDPATDSHYRQGATNYVEQVVRAAVAYGIITRSGSWYSVGDTSLGQGAEKTAAALEADPDLLDSVREQVLAQEGLRSGGGQR